VILLLGAGTIGEALAHQLRVFAFADGARITGSAYFAGGGAATGARIEVRDDSGALLAELTPDATGHFAYLAQAAIDHRILAISGDGHRAEWRVAADELIGAPRVAAEQPESALDVPTAQTAPAATPLQAGLDPALEAAIERAVARQIRPLREQLIAAEERTRLRDILGGFGYILGLTGLALWWRSRHRDGT
jgi:nickel transport protein